MVGRLTGTMCLVFGALAMPLVAQDSEVEAAAEARPDPAAIMRSADKAMSEFETLTFSVNTRGIGAMATRSPQTQATAQIRRASERNPIGWMFRIEGVARRGNEANPFVTAFDGREVRSVREHEKVVVESTWETSAEAMADGAGFALAWIVRWRELVSRPFEGDGDVPAWMVRYEGIVEVDGTVCDVVYVDYSEARDPNLYDAWWYIAREDSLPRRVDMHMVDRAGDGFVVTVISDLELEAPVESSSLRLATPDGFELRAAEEPERPRARGRRPAGIPVGDLAPDWTLKDPGGREHTLSDYRGKVVIMDFWATWCGPCLRAMPGLQALHEKYGEGVVVFGVNCWESGDPEAMMAREGYTYPLLLEGDPVAALYMVSGIPTFYVISPEGRVAHLAVGFDPAMEETLSDIIEAFLP